MLLNSPKIQVKIPQNTPLIIRLFLSNQTDDILLLRPVLEDWLIESHTVVCSQITVEPAYVTLYPGQQGVTQKIILQLPPVQAEQSLRSQLRFPGWQEAGIPVQVEILPVMGQRNQAQITDLKLAFPLEAAQGVGGLSLNPHRLGIIGLTSALLELDQIPSRWLLAELLIRLCRQGEVYRQTEEGEVLWEGLQETAFFQSGAIASSTLQFPQWILDTLVKRQDFLSAEVNDAGGLVTLWEGWLWSLVDNDLEQTEQSNLPNIPRFQPEDGVKEWGSDVQRWWGNLLLGLSQISPLINATLHRLVEEFAPVQSLPDSDISYHLNLILPSLDILPARWLVVELLAILGQQGEIYAQTENGSQLLNQLHRTRFFKNGVLAVATAHLPRWLHISQQATSAYQDSLGKSDHPGGLIYTAEQWFKSLLPDSLQADWEESWAQPTNLEGFVERMERESDRIFAAVILGLMQLSPQLNTRLTKIAQQAPESPPAPSKPTFPLEDILSENESLQR
ncbi:hypothetical protein PN462_11305 [Spirulina sp. CS-785/01]|uniref:hypothetical protein n=1 Tax=Spirulina sp. CS-785/01 TaxID=3021716 RepID=UPI0023304D5A|nr:hypothetical protein [Spirulina sp. CS-785/01]MDB9313688.1 hypothetical protein [Spirulina sp. CS-785/01]